ncbi:hypothetical protein [Rhizobium sp. BG4]|uniref:hypothetical protein n=1 Tax=Rhizobium sp. BG4 TaxID=2613770 RepID=UPI00193D5120|nr:hypothetical protein [Rhizobium sp. BG4]QRM44602.1 hypothetical protein F2982_14815 [Rhizobium sp. BG4]
MPQLLIRLDDKLHFRLQLPDTFQLVTKDRLNHFSGRKFDTVVERELPESDDGSSEERRFKAVVAARPKHLKK